MGKYIPTYYNYIFENTDMEIKFHCHECGWIGWLPMKKIVTCPKCKTKNDVWKKGNSIPKRHKLLNSKFKK